MMLHQQDTRIRRRFRTRNGLTVATSEAMADALQHIPKDMPWGWSALRVMPTVRGERIQVMEDIELEELGFCGLGEGSNYVKEGNTRLGGSMPCNTDGGLLSNSHCGNPTGMMTIEVVRQLRGECGARQVPDAKIGLALSQGNSVHGVAGTLLMATD